MAAPGLGLLAGTLPSAELAADPGFVDILCGAVGRRTNWVRCVISFRGLTAPNARWRTLGSLCVVGHLRVGQNGADDDATDRTTGDARHLCRGVHAVDPHHPRDHPVPADGVRGRQRRAHPDAVIIALATGVAVLTSISLAAIATNIQVKGGGDYYLISRTLGVEFGGAIGVVLFLAQSVSVGFYAIGFGEITADLLGFDSKISVQIIALLAVLLLVRVRVGRRRCRQPIPVRRDGLPRRRAAVVLRRCIRLDRVCDPGRRVEPAAAGARLLGRVRHLLPRCHRVHPRCQHVGRPQGSREEPAPRHVRRGRSVDRRVCDRGHHSRGLRPPNPAGGRRRRGDAHDRVHRTADRHRRDRRNTFVGDGLVPRCTAHPPVAGLRSGVPGTERLRQGPWTSVESRALRPCSH